MTKARLFGQSSVLAGSMVGGALASALSTHWLASPGTGCETLSLILGAAFGFLGWFLSENLGDAVVVLMGTAFPGLVVLSFLQDETLRIMAIAFLCGFNIGKLMGGIYKEFT